MTSARIARSLKVRAGAIRVAMAAADVAEVIRVPRITRMPHGPACLLGVAHARGIVLPVVALSALIGAGHGTEATRIVVLRHEPPIGLAVDCVEALQPLSPHEAQPEHGHLTLGEGADARAFDLNAALRAHFSTFRTGARSQEGATGQPAPRAPDDKKAFLTVSLAGQSYALPLDAIAEVMDAPASLQALPHTEAVLSGILEWRGQILPAVSLRTLLGLADRDRRSSDRTLIARIGTHHLALLVDHVGAILRAAPHEIAPVPSLFNRGDSEARIDAVLRLPDGRGLVSILMPDRILADARTARLLAAAPHRGDTPMAPAAQNGAHKRFLVVRLGRESYGLPIASVEEVVRMPDILTPLPRAPAYVQGVMNLRGRVMPVIDQRRRFGSDGAPEQAARHIVVVAAADVRAGLAVDAVASILEVAEADLMAAPELSGHDQRLFRSAAPIAGDRQGDMILLIDPKILLA